MNIPNTVGTRVKVARKAKGWKQSTMARKVGISASTLSDIERGKVDMKFSQAIKISRELDIDLNYLAGRGSHEHANPIGFAQLEMYYALQDEFKIKIDVEIEFLHSVSLKKTQRKKI